MPSTIAKVARVYKSVGSQSAFQKTPQHRAGDHHGKRPSNEGLTFSEILKERILKARP
jgi:hypothetical protein